jgi:hypothetical protein
MSEAMIRGAWLIAGVKFMRAHFSAETNEYLLASLPKALRSSLAELQPVQWCPRAHHVEMLRAIAAAHRDEAAAQASLLAYGQSAANDATSGAWRPLSRILTPKLLGRKLPNFWLNDHQEDGVLESDIAQIAEGRLPFTLSAIDGYDNVGIATLGWIKGLLLALGRKDVTVQQSGWSLHKPGPSAMTCEVRWS